MDNQSGSGKRFELEQPQVYSSFCYTFLLYTFTTNYTDMLFVLQGVKTLKAEIIYVILKKSFYVSRSLRIQWFLQHLNSKICIGQTDNVSITSTHHILLSKLFRKPQKLILHLCAFLDHNMNKFFDANETTRW